MKSQAGVLRQQIIRQPHQLNVFNGIYNFIDYGQLFLEYSGTSSANLNLKRYRMQLYRNRYTCSACLLVLYVAKFALLALACLVIIST